MRTFTVVLFDREERDRFTRVVPSLTVAFPAPRDDENARAINALAGAADATHEILSRARIGLTRQMEVCERERRIEHWTHDLAGDGPPITPETGSSGLFVNPYFTCQTLAQARAVQYDEAAAALALIDAALPMTEPRPNLKYAGL